MIKDFVELVSPKEAKSVLSSFCRYNDWRYEIDDCKVLGRSKLDDNLYLIEVIDEDKQYIFNSMSGKIDPNAKFEESKININKIKESKNVFPCTIYMVNQDWDEEIYYYLDTPDYGLDWRYCDDVEQEDIENYKYVIKNITDLRTSIKNLKETFIGGYGDKYFKLSKNYMEELLNRGETLVCSFNSNVDDKERIFIIKIEPVQNLELSLAESFEKTIKSLQKEGLFENVKSFDLDFNGKGINIRLNEASEVTYMQDFSIEDYYNDITEVEAAASELGISISFDDNEIYAKASSEEVLKQFLYDWGIIENDADFEAGLLY